MEGNSATLLNHRRSQVSGWGPPLGDPWAEDVADQATVSAHPHWNLPTYGEVRIGDSTFQPYCDLGFSRRQKTNTLSPDARGELEDWEHVSLEHGLNSLCDTAPAQEHPAADASCDDPPNTAATEAAVSAPVATAPSITDDASPSQPTTLHEQLRLHFTTLQHLSKRASLGDEIAVGEIQSILNDNEELWRYLGDVELSTEAMLIEFLSGPAAVKESVRRQVKDLKRSLTGDHPTPLERLAVGRVVACWLFTQFVERWCGHAVKESGRTGGLGTLLEAGEKRLQTAIKTLKLARGIRS